MLTRCVKVFSNITDYHISVDGCVPTPSLSCQTTARLPRNALRLSD